MVFFDLRTNITFTLQVGPTSRTFTVPNARLVIVRGTFNGATNLMDPQSQVPFSIYMTGPGIEADLTFATVYLNKDGFTFEGLVEVTLNFLTIRGTASLATYSYGQVQYPDLLEGLADDPRINIIPGFILGGTNVLFPILFDDGTSTIITIQNPAIQLPSAAQYFPRSGSVVIPEGTSASIISSPLNTLLISLLQSFNIREDGTVDLFNKRIFVNGRPGTIIQQAGYPLIIDTLDIIAAKLKRISSDEPGPSGSGGEELVCICGHLIPRSQVFLPSHCLLNNCRFKC